MDMALKRNNRRRAAAAVEFALIALPLFLLIIGLLDYGWMFLKVQHVTQAARNGARAAIVPDATPDHVRAVVAARMTEANIDPDAYNVQITPANIVNIPPGTPITVRITVNTETAEMNLTGSGLIPKPDQIHTAASMAKEGPRP